MKSKFYLIFCLILFYKLCQLNAEPIRRLSYVPPFPQRYLPPQNFNDNENYDYDYLNNVSLGRLLQDDNTLVQQTDQLSNQVKNSIANKLMNLANRLHHAANILIDRSSRRSYHNHRSRNSPRTSNENIFGPKQPTTNNPRRSNDNLSTQKPTTETISNTDSKSTTKPIVDLPRQGAEIHSNIESEFLNNKEQKDDKKRQDEEESRNESFKREKRDVDEYTNEDSSFKTVTKMQLMDVSGEVKTGFESVIKLLKNYLDNPPLIDNKSAKLKRSNERAEQLLENMEEAKRIFNQIDSYVQQQYLDNILENRNQTELLNYFDKIIRVEKNRIGQALSEYTNQLATNYRLQPTLERDQNEKPVRRETEYQNDDDRDLNSYVNERERESDTFFRNRNTNYFNEIPAEEKLRRIDRNEPKSTLIIRRVYIPPKVVSRPTRRHPTRRDMIKPPYETSISASNKEPIDHDNENEYEMVEP